MAANKISEIPETKLSSLTKLTNLELGANKIKKIQGLEGLSKLEQLWLGKNKIESLEGLNVVGAFKNLSLLSVQVKNKILLTFF